MTASPAHEPICDALGCSVSCAVAATVKAIKTAECTVWRNGTNVCNPYRSKDPSDLCDSRCQCACHDKAAR